MIVDVLLPCDEPFAVGGRELSVAASIGIALGAARTKRPEELLREADTAKYRAKEESLVHDQATFSVMDRCACCLRIAAEIAGDLVGVVAISTGKQGLATAVNESVG